MDKKKSNNIISTSSSKMTKFGTKSTHSNFGKCVKFENNVVIFKIYESGKTQVQKCPLRLEEDQAKRRLKERNS